MVNSIKPTLRFIDDIYGLSIYEDDENVLYRNKNGNECVFHRHLCMMVNGDKDIVDVINIGDNTILFRIGKVIGDKREIRAHLVDQLKNSSKILNQYINILDMY